MLNGNGKVAFGLRQIRKHHVSKTDNHYLHSPDVLHRERDHRNSVHVMKYIFPRQFGLHNVFTSDIDPKDTAQPFKDYTLREQEIKRANSKSQRGASGSSLPKRLRGESHALITRLMINQARCPYSTLLEYYCPSPIHGTHNGDNSVVDGECMTMTTPLTQVSAFCRAVISRVFPTRLWGEGEARVANKARMMYQIDRFVRLRRYETITLHEVLQEFKVTISYTKLHIQHTNICTDCWHQLAWSITTDQRCKNVDVRLRKEAGDLCRTRLLRL